MKRYSTAVLLWAKLKYAGSLFPVGIYVPELFGLFQRLNKASSNNIHTVD